MEDRLTGWNGVTSAFDADGLRTKKASGSGTSYYLYDGADPVLELSSTGAVQAVNSFGAQGLVSRHASSSTFYEYDPQGSVAHRLNSANTVLSNDVYEGSLIPVRSNFVRYAELLAGAGQAAGRGGERRLFPRCDSSHLRLGPHEPLRHWKRTPVILLTAFFGPKRTVAA